MRKKITSNAPAAESGRLFQKQLSGEEGPSLAAASQLCELMVEFAVQQPWRRLADGDLIIFQDPRTGDICYCCVMGALGEVFSMHAYIGPESYRLFRKVAAGRPVSAGEFFASQHGVNAELILPSKLTPPDRELLETVGYPMKRGIRVPIFRAFRTGYHPWYVTEDEAMLLTRCLWAVLTFCAIVSPDKSANFWPEEDVFPMMVPVGNDELRRDYEIKLVKVSLPPPPAWQAPPLDAATIRGIRQQNYPQGGIFEVDYALSSAAVGDKNERKASTQFALVSDPATGFLFPPALGEPPDSAGDLLLRAVLMALSIGRQLPQEIHVNDSKFKAVLEPLAVSLGLAIRVKKSLPSVREARNFLLQQLGEPKPFAG